MLALSVPASAQEYQEEQPTDEISKISEAPKDFIIKLSKTCKKKHPKDTTGMALCMKEKQSEIDDIVKETEKKRQAYIEKQAETYIKLEAEKKRQLEAEDEAIAEAREQAEAPDDKTSTHHNSQRRTAK